VNSLRIGLLLALAVAAAVVANVVLLGVATGSSDSVGNVSFPTGPASTLRPPPPRTTVTPPSTGGDHRDSHEDD
jgi:hypothetical protein